MISLTEVLEIWSSSQVDTPAQDETEVDNTEHIAGVEERDREESDDGVDQLRDDHDHLGLHSLRIKHLIIVHHSKSSHDDQHQLMSSVASVTCQRSRKLISKHWK